MRLDATLAIAVFALLASGCAATRPPPPVEVTRADQQIRLAEDFGAEGEPAAALYLALARENLAAAHSAARRGEVELASRLAARSQVDADIAMLITREANVRQAAERSIEEADLLAEELSR